MRRMTKFGLLAGLLALGTASLANAETFPSKSVRLIVPYPAGGSVDNIARAVVLRLGPMWGQPIVIENKGGGATQIGADMVAKSPPDGHTLFATGMETFSINPYLMAKLSYDAKEFVPVSGFGASNQLLVVPAASPLHSVAQLIAQAKAKPGELQYGTIGVGG